METKLKQTGDINKFSVEILGKSKASNPSQSEKNFKALKKALTGKAPKKKVFILFMSHKSGEHGLTVHNTVKAVKDEVKSVIDLIKENDGISEEAHNNDLAALEEITGDGNFGELSDTTWFSVFERKV